MDIEFQEKGFWKQQIKVKKCLAFAMYSRVTKWRTYASLHMTEIPGES